MLSASGCPHSDDAIITCDNFDYFLATCYPECVITWDCEYNYDSLPVENQLILDDCSDCLAIEADTLSCGDCTYYRDGYEHSCFAFMTDTLGLACF